MNIISIDNRLKDIASMIDKCHSIADIGTDHGYLPIFLIQNNIIDRAYACDIAINPLKKAQANIKKYQLDDKIKTVLSNGLENVYQDVDYVIIAGMGANLIIDILKNKKKAYPYMILQANLNNELLRRYLSENNYTIIDEKISYVNKKYYEIIKVRNGYEKLNDLQIKYGPINLLKKSKLFIEKWQATLNKYKNIILNFKGNSNDLNKLLINIKEIEEVLS